MSESVEWFPATASTPLTIDIRSFFRRALDD
jgi:hypothetical protein